MQFFRRREYRRPLLSESDPDLEYVDSEHDNNPRPSKLPTSRLSKIASLLAVSCTVFNLVYLAYISIPVVLHRGSELTSLPRPNQFVGLDRINYTKHPFPNVKIATFAGVIAQIDRARPNFVYPVDPRRKFTYFGTVSPDDRNVLATNEISTIMQFRTRDFGMEWCKFKLTLPDSAQYDPNDPKNEPLREKDWILEGDTTDLEVWELDAPHWIDEKRLSYNTRPQRKAHIFSFRVQANKTLESREFRCRADEIGTFELVCISPGCKVDIWQNKIAATYWRVSRAKIISLRSKFKLEISLSVTIHTIVRCFEVLNWR